MSCSQIAVCILFLLIATIDAAPRSDDEYNENAYEDEPTRRQAQSYDPNAYNPSARDFTARCMRMAQFSGSHSCDAFNLCCSEDNVLNKLNGDKCQIADPTNGCNLNRAGNEVQWSQCRAFNCTDEITTTTTTTQRTPASKAPPLILICGQVDQKPSSSLLVASTSLLLALPILLWQR
ncbi:hypothetical protein M3Y94_00094100 [Aphelenchoides besseyi]|nr:hypothetical protein M3Y94_00094100 [Aphelenchoides besseyi]